MASTAASADGSTVELLTVLLTVLLSWGLTRPLGLEIVDMGLFGEATDAADGSESAGDFLLACITLLATPENIK